MPRRHLRPAAHATNDIVTELRFVKSFAMPTVICRLCTAVHAIDLASPGLANIKVEDIIDEIYAQADSNDETLGQRTTQAAHTALSRLHRNSYIKFLPHRDDVEIIVLTPAFKKMMEELNALRFVYSSTIEDSSKIVTYRAICDFFRRKLQRNLKPALTRRELDLRNRELELEHEEYLQHLQTCLLGRRSPSVALTEIFGEAPELIARDSMYFDDVSQVATVVAPTIPPPATPIRRSTTLNNREAYPSPESARRQIPQQPTTPPRSPFRRNSSIFTPGSLAHDPAQEDADEMDVNGRVAPSTDLLLASQVEPHEEGRAKISGLEKELRYERANHAAEKNQWLLTLWARQAWVGCTMRRLRRENEGLRKENKTIKAEKKEEEQLVALGRLSLGFTAQANSILGLTR